MLLARIETQETGVRQAKSDLQKEREETRDMLKGTNNRITQYIALLKRERSNNEEMMKKLEEDI